MSKLTPEEVEDKLNKYLDEHGIAYEDIHSDENGSFYFSIDDTGEVTDPGYRVTATRIYLPDELQPYV